MVSYINSFTFKGIEIEKVNLQVHLTPGMPCITIIGLADKTISESRDRISAAFNSIGLNLPQKRITVNLSPADLLKEGSHFDLAIACGLLIAMKIIPQEALENYLIFGELGLDGTIASVSGALPAAIGANALNMGVICPFNNGPEAAWSGNDDIIAPSDLISLINHFKFTQILTPPKISDILPSNNKKGDMREVIGQNFAKRAMEIAAAGSHNILLSGPPGAGKSMLASRLSTIMPSMTPKEMLECSMISSISGMNHNGKIIQERPFRDPHHSCSMAAMVGGGSTRKIMPGEISLAHNGVLFLDEFPEFQRPVLDALRQPMEAGSVLIARAASHICYPARFQLVAAMNPCRCGFLSDPEKRCSKAPLCGSDYQSKISGPILDRMDMKIHIPAITPAELRESKPSEDSRSIQQRVEDARVRQLVRFEGYNIVSNAELGGDLLTECINMTTEARELLNTIADKMKLSMRGYNRVIKVAQTIADLENCDIIQKIHISESAAYRH